MTDKEAQETQEDDVSLRRQYLNWRYGAINLVYLLFMHSVLIGWLVFARGWMPFGGYVLSSLLVSTIYLRILTEWFHEATHWNLVPGRRLNDFLGDLLIGTPIGTQLNSNRPGHFRHHAATEFFNADDPDTLYQAAGSIGELVVGILRDLSGITAVSTFLRATQLGTESGQGGRLSAAGWFIWLLVFHGTCLVLSIQTGRYEIYPIYVVSVLCLYPVANRFRLFTQHAWIRDDGSVYLVDSGASRTYHGSLMTQLILISPMIMYHYEHHARPSLPYRALRSISAVSDDPNRFGTQPFRFLGTVLTRL